MHSYHSIDFDASYHSRDVRPFKKRRVYSNENIKTRAGTKRNGDHDT